MKRTLVDAKVGELRQDVLHEFVDACQLNLAELHGEIARTWFGHDMAVEQLQVQSAS